MKKIIVAATILASIAVLHTAAVSNERAAAKFAEAATRSGMKCAAKNDERLILCIVNAADAQVDAMAIGMVAVAREQELPLRGWTLTIVSLGDYVVSLPILD